MEDEDDEDDDDDDDGDGQWNGRLGEMKRAVQGSSRSTVDGVRKEMNKMMKRMEELEEEKKAKELAAAIELPLPAAEGAGVGEQGGQQQLALQRVPSVPAQRAPSLSSPLRSSRNQSTAAGAVAAAADAAAARVSEQVQGASEEVQGAVSSLRAEMEKQTTQLAKMMQLMHGGGGGGHAAYSQPAPLLGASTAAAAADAAAATAADVAAAAAWVSEEMQGAVSSLRAEMEKQMNQLARMMQLMHGGGMGGHTVPSQPTPLLGASLGAPPGHSNGSLASRPSVPGAQHPLPPVGARRVSGNGSTGSGPALTSEVSEMLHALSAPAAVPPGKLMGSGSHPGAHTQRAESPSVPEAEV